MREARIHQASVYLLKETRMFGKLVLFAVLIGGCHTVELIDANNSTSDTGSDTDHYTDTDTKIDEDTDTDVGIPPTCVRRVDSSSTAPIPGGLSWSNAFPTVQKGIDSAAAAGKTCQVWVKKGTYYIFVNNVENTLQMRPNVAVYGGFSGIEVVLSERDWNTNVTVLSGYEGPSQNNRVENVVTGANDSLIDGFTIQGGRSVNSSGGGAFLCEGTSPEIRNCKISGNHAELYGGGIYVNDGAQPFISNTIFHENSSGDDSGAIHVKSAFVVIENCVFWGNSAIDDGGAIKLRDGSIAKITNCTFHGNRAQDAGGAIYTADSNVSIINTILWSNTPDQIHDSNNQSTVSYCDVQNKFPGTGNIDFNPSFVDEEKRNFELQADSPCIDAGDGLAAPPTDFRGLPRVDIPETENTGVGSPWADIGAFERQP